MKYIFYSFFIFLMLGCGNESKQNDFADFEEELVDDVSGCSSEIVSSNSRCVYVFSDLGQLLYDLLQDDSDSVLDRIKNIEMMVFSKEKYRYILIDELIESSPVGDWGNLIVYMIDKGGMDEIAIKLFRRYVLTKTEEAVLLLNQLNYSDKYRVLYDEFAFIIDERGHGSVFSYVNKIKDERTRVLMTTSAFYSALDENWDQANHILRNETVDPRLTIDMYYQLFSKWGSDEIGKVLEHANSIKDKDLREVAFSAISKKLAKVNADDALILYNSISEEYDELRNQVFGQIVEMASLKSAELALSMIDSNYADSEKGQMVRRMMLHFDPNRDDVFTLMNWLDQHEVGSDKEVILGQLVDRFCDYDLQSAQEMIESHMVGSNKDLAYLVFVENWGEESPLDAVNWITKLDVSENTRNDLYQSVFEEYVKIAPIEAAKFSLERGDAALQSLVASDVVSELAKVDINAAINWIDGVNSTVAVYSALGELCEELVRNDPHSAYQYTQKFTEYSDEYVKTLWEDIASIDPVAGIDVLNAIEDRYERKDVAEIFSKNLARSDLRALEELIYRSEDDAVRSVAKSNLALAKLDSNIDSSVDVATGISDGVVRLNTLKAVFKNWKIRGYPGLRRKIESLRLPSAEKQEILNSL